MKNFAYYKKGQVVILAVLFFLSISTVILFGIVSPIIFQVRNVNTYYKSQESYLAAESAVEDILYRLKNGKQVGTTETFNLNGGTVTVVITNTPSGKRIIATGNVDNKIRKIQVDIVNGTGVSFHYGVQVGNGGLVMQNSSSIIGNVHSGGTVTGSGNYIRGDVVSSGSTGLINSIHATGTAFAHTIQSSTIDKDAYYVVKTSTTVGGVSYPNSPDQGPAELPISDEQITEWENDAVAGGTISSPCPYTISSGTVSLGPTKINCDFVVSNSAILNVTGPIWVSGNITVRNSAQVKMDSSLGSQNVAIIADKISDRANSSTVSVQNSASFAGSGAVGSFVFLISQNNSAENGGSVDAMSLGNSASALVAYASHGNIPLANSINLKEVTAYRLTLKNSAQVTYDTGLPSVLFDSGPGGGYEITSWKEIE